MSQHTVRRRLDFAVDQDCQIAKSLPFIAKDAAVKKDEELEIRQAEKKLKTSIVTINNNVVPAENPLNAAKALSREQLLKCRTSHWTLQEGGGWGR